VGTLTVALIDFHQNWHRHKNPKSKNEFVGPVLGVNITPSLPYFASKTCILGQEVVKIQTNINQLNR